MTSSWTRSPFAAAAVISGLMVAGGQLRAETSANSGPVNRVASPAKGSPTAPPNKPPVARVVPWHRLVLVGDSIVANVPGGSWESGLPARVQSVLPRWVVWPYARGLWTVGLDWYGSNHFGGRGSPDPEALRPMLAPGDAIVILLGTNDFRLSRPIAELMAGYGRLLDRVAQADLIMSVPEPTIRVCVTPIWRKDADKPNDFGLVLADYAKAIREVCSRRGVAVVDGFDLVRPGETQLIDSSDVHPTMEGTRLLGERLGEKLLPVLDRGPAR
ncbi:MAG: SGNH/GDSL hydrolase family protein [Alphaproteobacteria bacterium]